ncbi:MAG: N-6 DNA methylase [Prevotella sp.]|nr:N-6 DNA methylase [Prevotella sp.]
MDLAAIYDIETYIDTINRDYHTGVATEHSFRGPLQNLLRALLNDSTQKGKQKIAVINEPKRKSYGAPDFEFRRDDVAIAYLETKNLGDKDLTGADNRGHKAQFDRYKRAVNLIAFTDYLRFFLYENGEQTLTATIGEMRDGEIVASTDERQLADFLRIIYTLGHAEPQPIHSAKLLAEAMAAKAKVIATVLGRAMEQDGCDEDHDLHTKLAAFQKFLVHDMTVAQFTDFYAQTIVYGLFVARIYDRTPETFSLQEAADLIPAINPFLKKIFKHLALADLHSGIRWIVEDLVAIFRVTEMAEVMRNYGKDPLVHFYEEFLEQYNPKIREDFGVWYTPREVVTFIVDAVDVILQHQLGVKRGIADNTMMTFKGKPFHRVQILDPATGTGTFLAVAAEKIYGRYKGQEGLWPEDVVRHVIPRLNGFEYLMAPYTMAHLKVATSLHLDELQEQLPERLQIFLTNSLEEDHPEESLDFAKFITDESNAASSIKRDTPVMVVMGNPPYNERSANTGKWIMDLMDDYKQEPGQQKERVGTGKNREPIYRNTLKETNPKGLNNDYCKFIRLGQKFVEQTQEGILAYICGNTFLDTSLFRGMRYELLRTFDEIYIVNLHGSTKRKESTKERKDECVFNIMVGVSINIFVKRKQAEHDTLAHVYYKDVYGSQREKLNYLATHNLNNVDFEELTLTPPLYTFRLRNIKLREQYNEGFNVRELMAETVQGFKTDKDNVAIQYQKENVEEIVQAMLSSADDSHLREVYGFRDNRDWSLTDGRAMLKKIKKEDLKHYISQVQYRPFDIRWTFFHRALVTYPRPLIQSSVHNRRNVVLCLGKEGSTIGDNEWSLAYISTLPTDINVIPRGGVYLFPLLVYDQLGMVHANFSPSIVRKVEQATHLMMQPVEEESRGEGGFLPIDLLDYIYAVLHSRRYRHQYHECLQDGFPTIPYPPSASYFLQMAQRGGTLRRLHLLDGIDDGDRTTTYPVRLPKDNNLCTRREFVETGNGQGRVWINDAQYFDHVPTEAWQAVVAGYHPLDRWLKDRKGKQLSNDEILHYEDMVTALRRAAEVMEEIDRIILL